MMLENMPFSSMDIGVCFMNVSSDGSITAGLVIEVDTVLKASISCDVDIASVRNNEHSIAITRNGDNLIRRYSFFGGPDVVEKFLISSLPINKNYYLGGDRISS